MKNILIAVVVIVVLVAGWWYYATMPAAAPEMQVENTMPVPGTDTMDTVVVREFTVTGTPFKFDIDSISVKKGETVRITFVNAEGKHDWVVDEFAGGRTKVLDAGQSETIEFVADKVGSFEYYCSVGQHRAMGMKGTLVVSE